VDATPYTGAGARSEHAYRELRHWLLAGEFGLGPRLAEEGIVDPHETDRQSIGRLVLPGADA
jgi:DNA-binding GntR family transcriptional regulator